MLNLPSIAARAAGTLGNRMLDGPLAAQVRRRRMVREGAAHTVGRALLLARDLRHRTVAAA